MRKICAVIPCFNPGNELLTCLNSLDGHDAHLSEIILIDSSTKSGLREFVMEGVSTELNCIITILTIENSDFDHGATRTLGLKRASTNHDYCLVLTQDAVVCNNCISYLCQFLESNNLAAVYARQLARDGAGFVESMERRYNYGNNSYIINSKPESLQEVFFSNTCALYRISSLLHIGGFVENTPTGEDTLTASKLLHQDYSIGYCACATVRHSHDFTLMQLFRRYFDIGAMHHMYGSILPRKKIRRTGAGFVKYCLQHCASFMDYVRVLETSIVKYMAYVIGKNYILLPRKLRTKLSANSAFWNKRFVSDTSN